MGVERMLNVRCLGCAERDNGQSALLGHSIRG